METKYVLEQQVKEEQSAVLVVNTHSRQGQHLFFTAADLLEQRGIHVTALYPVRHPDHFPEVMKEAIAQGTKLVVVGGGDGTMSAVVDSFAYQDVVLGILPLGTGNSFARTLGIPLSLDGAIDVIVNGKVVDVDLGKVNEDYFANVATLGFSAEVARRTPNRLKKLLGVYAYAISGITIFFSHNYFICTFTSQEKQQTIKTHQMIITNGSFYGIMKIMPEASVDNRQLLVYTMDSCSRWQVLKFWLALLSGNHALFPETRHFTTKEITIHTDPPQHIDIDGEITTQPTSPLVTISLAPEALKVIAPSSFEEPLG